MIQDSFEFRTSWFTALHNQLFRFVGLLLLPILPNVICNFTHYLVCSSAFCILTYTLLKSCYDTFPRYDVDVKEYKVEKKLSALASRVPVWPKTHEFD